MSFITSSNIKRSCHIKHDKCHSIKLVTLNNLVIIDMTYVNPCQLILHHL